MKRLVKSISLLLIVISTISVSLTSCGGGGGDDGGQPSTIRGNVSDVITMADRKSVV